jgi:hypothetical protein
MSPADDHTHLIEQIAGLPDNWHGAGTVERPVLEAIADFGREHPIRSSAETGTGRTTLLLSHLSEAHVVFAKDDAGDGDSLAAVQGSPLLRRDRTQFVIGPTQQTILSHDFTDLDLALIDGPHAYPFPDLEYWALYPRIKVGGVLIVDDIQIPTIRNMYEVITADSMWDEIRVVSNTAFFRRTPVDAVDPYGEGWWQQGYNQPRVRPAVVQRAGRVVKRLARRG